MTITLSQTATLLLPGFRYHLVGELYHFGWAEEVHVDISLVLDTDALEFIASHEGKAVHAYMTREFLLEGSVEDIIYKAHEIARDLGKALANMIVKGDFSTLLISGSGKLYEMSDGQEVKYDMTDYKQEGSYQTSLATMKSSIEAKHQSWITCGAAFPALVHIGNGIMKERDYINE